MLICVSTSSVDWLSKVSKLSRRVTQDGHSDVINYHTDIPFSKARHYTIVHFTAVLAKISNNYQCFEFRVEGFQFLVKFLQFATVP